METTLEAVSDDRIDTLIVLLNMHGGGFANYTIMYDELLAILRELRDLRARVNR